MAGMAGLAALCRAGVRRRTQLTVVSIFCIREVSLMLSIEPINGSIEYFSFLGTPVGPKRLWNISILSGAIFVPFVTGSTEIIKSDAS